jgi:hypothetical protein
VRSLPLGVTLRETENIGYARRKPWQITLGHGFDSRHLHQKTGSAASPWNLLFIGIFGELKGSGSELRACGTGEPRRKKSGHLRPDFFVFEKLFFLGAFALHESDREYNAGWNHVFILPHNNAFHRALADIPDWLADCGDGRRAEFT